MHVKNEDIEKSKEINLDLADFNTGGESTDDSQRKNRKLQQVDDLKQKIIQARMAAQDYGLSITQDKIRALQDERTAILFGPTTKDEILTKAKEIINERKKEVLMRHLMMPLSVQKDNNLLPLSHIKRHTFSEEDIEKIFFLAISDDDLQMVVSQMPDTGLSQAERQAKIKEINSQIEELEASLEKELKAAEKELQKRHDM